MKNCTDCKHAEWTRTESGRLHPSGLGRCKFEWKSPPIPACMYWIGMTAPTPLGWRISRKEEMKEHCVYFSKAEAKKP